MNERERIEYLPTPREIAQACAAIRASWSLSERRRRLVGGRLEDDPAPSWHPPVIDTSPLRGQTARGLADLAV